MQGLSRNLREAGGVPKGGCKMKYRARLLLIASIPAFLLAAACAPVEPPPQDPTKEQITLLQKQLLELQKVQNDTKQKLDESVTTIESLNSKIMSLEEGQPVRPAPRVEPQIEPKPADTTTQIQKEKKPAPKPLKKKKKKKRAVKKKTPVGRPQQ